MSDLDNKNNEEISLNDEQLENVSGGSLLGKMVTCSWCNNEVDVSLFYTMKTHKQYDCPARSEHKDEDPSVN